MIELSETEKRMLAAKFADVPDRELIRELLRRGRFRQYEASATYYKELKDDDRYMGMIRHGLLHTVAHQIDDDKDHRPAMIAVRDDVNDYPQRRSIMTSHIVALVARDRKEG